MPIDLKTYNKNWATISKFIRYHRAKNCCEACGAPNGMVILRFEKGWTLAPDHCQVWSWQQIREANSGGSRNERFTKIVLTVAHVDQNKNNNSFFNLKAWCQACHLHHDRFQHARNRRYGRYHKEKQYYLF